MEQWECQTKAGVLLFDKFVFTPFKGKTIVVVGMHIPTTSIEFPFQGKTQLFKTGL
jgi:hypothetical protein